MYFSLNSEVKDLTPGVNVINKFKSSLAMLRQNKELWLDKNTPVTIINQSEYSNFFDDSVTRLGDFWKFCVTNFLTKVAQKLEQFLGSFKNIDF